MDRAIDALEDLMPSAELDPLSFADQGRQRRSVIATVAGTGPGRALVGVCVAAAFAWSWWPWSWPPRSSAPNGLGGSSVSAAA